MIARLRTIFVGSLVIAVLCTGIYFGVRAAYGAFRDYYYVTVDLPRAGQQVQRGSDVRIRGVNVGKVVDIELVDRRAQLTLQIEDRHAVPKSTEAVVTLKTFLGSKFVDLRFDPNDSGEKLADGDAIERAAVGAELEDALDDGTSVLEALNPQDVGTLVTELARASRGHGSDIARGLDSNAELSGVFASTLDPQVQAIDDFRVLFGELESKGADMNALAAAVNEGVPVYASNEAQRALARVLDNLVPFSNDLGDLIILNRRDFDLMMNAGDILLATVAGRTDGLSDLVTGLRTYVGRLGRPISHSLLPDGSAAAGFTNFIGGNDIEEDMAQVCSALPLDARGAVPLCKGDGR
jgi:phospholipid/cholesterol/gamma-HCH transport system substrate-binding protein